MLLLTITPLAIAFVSIAFLCAALRYAIKSIMFYKSIVNQQEEQIAELSAAKRRKPRKVKPAVVETIGDPNITYPTYRTVSHLGHRTMKEGKRDY